MNIVEFSERFMVVVRDAVHVVRDEPIGNAFGFHAGDMAPEVMLIISAQLEVS